MNNSLTKLQHNLIGYKLVQPEEPDFDSIDEACIKGLKEQIPTPPEEAARNEALFLHNSQFKVLYDKHSTIKGLIYFSSISDKPYIHIDFIYAVEKKVGIGRFLINELICMARINKYTKISLEVSVIDVGVIVFYEKLGFVKVGKTKKSIDLFQMELKV